MKIVKKIQLKIINFSAVKNRCILHGRVSVMLIAFLNLDPTDLRFEVSVVEFILRTVKTSHSLYIK